MKEKQRFERVVVSREEALAMFQENKFKVEIITGLDPVRLCCKEATSQRCHGIKTFIVAKFIVATFGTALQTQCGASLAAHFSQ